VIFPRWQVVLYLLTLSLIGWMLFPSEYTRGLMLRQEGDRSDSIAFFRSYLQRHPFHKGATYALSNAYEESGDPEAGLGPLLAFYRQRRGDLETGEKILGLMERCNLERRRRGFRWELIVDIKGMPIPALADLERLLYEAYQDAAARQDDKETFRALAELSKLPKGGESYRNSMLRLLLSRGKLLAALNILNQQFEQSPGNAELLRTIVKIHLMRKDYPKALEVLGKGIQEKPDAVGLLGDRADLLVKQERWAAAFKDFERLARLEPEKVAWLRELGACSIKLGRFDEGIRYFDKALMRRPWNKKIWWDIIYLYSDKENHAKAAARLEAYVRRFPSDKKGFEALAYAYERLGRIDKVMEILDQRLTRFTEDRQSRMRLGELLRHQGSVLIKKGRFQEGQQLYSKAIGIHPQDKQTWWDSIFAYTDRDYHVPAAERLEKYVDAFPDDPKGYSVLSVVLKDLGRLGRAIEILQIRVAKAPSDFDSRHELVRLLLAEERYAETIPHYDVLIAQQPKSEKLRPSLAYVYSTLDRDVEAAVVFREHLRLFPGDFRAMDKLIDLLSRTGQKEKAIAILHQYFGLPPRGAAAPPLRPAGGP